MQLHCTNTRKLTLRSIAVLTTVVLAATPLSAHAADFDAFGGAEQQLVAPVVEEKFIFEFELGGGGKLAPGYQGASTYKWGVNPIIGVDRLHIPGFIDIGGDDEVGFSFSPSIDITGARKSADYGELAGLNDVEATYAVGAKVGYDFQLSEQVVAGVYGELQHGFGASQGILGAVGAEVTAKLTPQFELAGGVSANYANESYMDKYFGVTAGESAASGGRFAAYDPTAGFKSVSLQLSARYEFIPDTFLNADASYTQLIGTAADSPISQTTNDGSFTVGLGISRKFSIAY